MTNVICTVSVTVVLGVGFIIDCPLCVSLTFKKCGSDVEGLHEVSLSVSGWCVGAWQSRFHFGCIWRVISPRDRPSRSRCEVRVRRNPV